MRAFIANFEQFVDLLLIFGEGKTYLGVVDGKNALECRCVLVQGDRDGADRLHGQHGGVQAGSVGSDHDHVLIATQAGQMQAASQLGDQRCQIGPSQGLPNAIFFFAHGRLCWSLRCVI